MADFRNLFIFFEYCLFVELSCAVMHSSTGRGRGSRSNTDLPPLRNGILASALAELQAQSNDSVWNDNNTGTKKFSSSSILTEAANQARSQKTTRRRRPLDDSPPSSYRGIIATALQNETASVNGYVPSQLEHRRHQLRADGGTRKLPSHGITPERPVSLNGSKAVRSSLDRALSVNGSDLLSPRYIGHQKTRSGMLGKWLQELAESTPDLSSQKLPDRNLSLEDSKKPKRSAEVPESLTSPRTGMLGVLLKERVKTPEKSASCRTQDHPPISPLSVVSDAYPFITETPPTKRPSSTSEKVLPEQAAVGPDERIPVAGNDQPGTGRRKQSGMLQQALENLSDTIINPALIFRESISTPNEVEKKDASARSRESSIKRSSIRSTTSRGSDILSVDENEFGKSPSSRVSIISLMGWIFQI